MFIFDREPIAVFLNSVILNHLEITSKCFDY